MPQGETRRAGDIHAEAELTTSMPTSSEPASSRSSSTRTIIIAVLAVIVLAGAAFVVYKLTHKNDTTEPPRVIAINVQKAVVAGNQPTIDKYTTAQGRAALADSRASSVASPSGPARSCPGK